MLIYSAVTNVLAGLISLLGRTVHQKQPRKFFRFINGQRNIITHVKETYKPTDDKPTVWIHAASFGEYSVARPLITEFKRRGMRTVVTFFSPTGYEAVENNHQQVDYLYYLPFDTRANANAFIDIIKPDKAVFIVSEYWFNYLDLLRRKGIDTFLVSAKITPQSVFFKWYGKVYRRCLNSYKHIFTVDNESVANLKSLGYNDAAISGNPLFDNAINKANTEWSDTIIEHFAKGNKVFIAGSIHDIHDLNMVAELANRHADIKFLMVPHEISQKTNNAIRYALHGKALAYSECNESTGFDGVQSLIIDHVGALAYIYRYAQWAYVGGGFTPYLHSLLEATVYGLPVAFGPMVHRKVTPEQIAALGIGQIVTNADELDRWFCELKDDNAKMLEIKAKAEAYVTDNAGSTQAIVDAILDGTSRPPQKGNLQ